MPHQFKATPNHPAVDYLVRLHADIGGRIQANKAEAIKLDEAMRHVEAVIKMFDPDYSVRSIAARRRHKTNPWFKRGTLYRVAIDVLRKATEPLTVKQVTDATLAAKGIKNPTLRQWRGIEAGIRRSLETNAGKGVERVGEGSPRRWRVI